MEKHTHEKRLRKTSETARKLAWLKRMAKEVISNKKASFLISSFTKLKSNEKIIEKKKKLTTVFLSGLDNNNAFWTEITKARSNKSLFHRCPEQGASQRVCKVL